VFCKHMKDLVMFQILHDTSDRIADGAPVASPCCL
jgi:hypothetical protein